MMKVLLEFNPEDVVKVFDPFFSKPEVAKIFKAMSDISATRIESFKDYIDKIVIKEANKYLKNNINDKALSKFVQLPDHLAGAYAIKIISLVKKHIETLLKNNELDENGWVSADPMQTYHIYRVFVISAAFAIVSYVKNKKIFAKLSPSMKQIISEMEKSETLGSLREIVEEKFFHNIENILAEIHSYNIKLLYKPIYSDEKWEVFYVQDYDQACVIGGNAYWCVSSSSGKEHMQRYKERNMNLFALLNKKNNNEKYLLALPVLDKSVTNMFDTKKAIEEYTEANKVEFTLNLLDKHIWNSLKEYLESVNFDSKVNGLKWVVENIQNDIIIVRDNALSKTFVEHFNNGALATVLFIHDKPHIIWNLFYELRLPDNPYLVKNDGIHMVMNRIKRIFDFYFEEHFNNVRLEEIQEKLDDAKPHIFPFFDMFVWEISFLHNFTDDIKSVFQRLSTSLNSEFRTRFGYELANIRNRTITFGSNPELERIYRRALPEYQMYFDTIGFNFITWLEKNIAGAYEKDFNLQKEIKSDFMKRNVRSRFGFIRNYLEYRNTSSKFRNLEKVYHETVDLYERNFKLLEELYEINPAIKQFMEVIQNNRDAFAFSLFNNYESLDPIINKDFLKQFESTFTISRDEYEMWSKQFKPTEEMDNIIKNTQGWIKTLAGPKPCRVLILITIVLREILKNVEDFPKELLRQLEEIIHEYLTRV